MDALTAALVAALLAHAGDRTPLFAAFLGERYDHRTTALVGFALAMTAVSVAAGIGAVLAAPRLAPEAKSLLLGLALLWSGAVSIGRLKPLRAPPRLGAFGAALGSGAVLAAADRKDQKGGAIGAVLAAPRLAPEAKSLLLGLALLWSGAVSIGRLKPLRAPPRLGAFGAALGSGAVLAAADRAPFLIFAIGAHSPLPWAAAIGGTLGALAIAVPAFYLDARTFVGLPLRAVRLIGAALFALAGSWATLAAFALV